MTYKVIEILFTDLQMAQNLEKALQDLSNEGFQIYSINTTFSSVLVVANKGNDYTAEQKKLLDDCLF